MDDSERRMRRRVKRVRRRVREGTTFTPQVARNYRMDMWRTPATPQYAYRPADSMTHMFRTKYDMIHQFNADLHQQEIRNIQAETEISKLQHQRKMAEKKTREYEREKILALQDKLAAEHAEEEARLEYKKEKKRLTSEHQAEMRKMKLDHERKSFKSQIKSEKDRFIQEESMRHDMVMSKRNLEATKHKVKRFQWEGMYTTNEQGEEVLKRGATKIRNLGLDIKVGERDVLQQRAKWEAEELVREKERKIAEIKSENEKLQGQINLEKDPTYIELLAEKTAAERLLARLQKTHEQNRKNDAVRRDLDRINVQIAKMKADSQEPSPELIQKRDEAIKELAAAKEQHNHDAEMLRLKRQIAEMQAQIGDPSQLDQQLQEKRQEARKMKKIMRDLDELESLDSHLAKSVHDLNDRTREAIARNEFWVNELNPVLPEPYRSDVNGSTDLDYRYVSMNSGVRAAIGQFADHMRQREELFTTANGLRRDDAFRRRTDELVDHALQVVTEEGNVQEFLNAHDMPRIISRDPQSHFAQHLAANPGLREPQPL